MPGNTSATQASIITTTPAASGASWSASGNAALPSAVPKPSALHRGRGAGSIRGNSYRLIVNIHYNTGIIFIRFVGTHAEYDKIDATTI